MEDIFDTKLYYFPDGSLQFLLQFHKLEKPDLPPKSPEEQVQELEARLTVQHEVMIGYQKQNQDLRSQIADKEQEIRNFIEELGIANNKIKELTPPMEESNQFEQKTEEPDQVQKQTEALAEAYAEIADYKQQIEELNQVQTKTVDLGEVQQLTLELNEANSDIKQIMEINLKQSNRIKSLQRSIQEFSERGSAAGTNQDDTKTNKKLKDENVKLTKLAQELDRRLKEAGHQNSRLQLDKNAQQRGDEMSKKYVVKVKAQEADINRLLKEVHNKDNHIMKLQKNLQDFKNEGEGQKKGGFNTRKVSQLLKEIEQKDHEIHMMKNMIQSWQVQYRQTESAMSRLKGGNPKLPSIQEQYEKLNRNKDKLGGVHKSQEIKRKPVKIADQLQFDKQGKGQMVSHRPVGSPKQSRPKRRPTPGRKTVHPEMESPALSFANESGQGNLESDSSGDEIGPLESTPILVDLKSRENLHVELEDEEEQQVAHPVEPWGQENDDLDPEESMRHNDETEHVDETTDLAEEPPAPMEFATIEKPVSPPSDQVLPPGFTFNDLQSNTPEVYHDFSDQDNEEDME